MHVPMKQGIRKIKKDAKQQTKDADCDEESFANFD